METIKRLLVLSMLFFNIYNLYVNGEMTYNSGGVYFLFSIACVMISLPCIIIYVIFKI